MQTLTIEEMAGIPPAVIFNIIDEVKNRRPNTLDKLIAKLEALRAVHGGDCRILNNGERIEVVEHVPAVGGCAEYINIGE